MRQLILLTLLMTACSHGYAAEDRVTVQETTLQLPTYVVGPEDRNPAFVNLYAIDAESDDGPLYNANVYPYPMRTDVTRRKENRPYRAVILENAYIRVIVLPELGGRVYAAHDKTNKDFDFIYHNHVIKPSLVALRGAWISGGIEWNFPTRGHTVNTFSPVLHKIVRGKDGSVTCVVGTLEWVRRMKWSVAITVYPGRSVFRDRILLFNGTLTHNRAYYWTNAAVHAWNDTRVTFPPTDHTFAGMRRRPEPWPIKQGKDVSWYRNTPYAHDFFCGTPGDYHGAYNYDRDCGTVHAASANESLGQKFWTWGTARSGEIWEDLLTDQDGQYIEIQAGRLLTQGDTWIFEPHMLQQWDEYWFPIKKMKGLVKANPEAAVNLTVEDGKLLAALNTTRLYENATIEVRVDGKTLKRQTISVGPRRPWQQEFDVVEQPKTHGIIVRDQQGGEIIDCQKPDPRTPPPELEPTFPETSKASAEEIYLRGYYAWKHWHQARAAGLFEEALRKDPGFTPAARMLAVFRYKAGRYREALDYCKKVLQRNEDDNTARYYSALCRIRLGISARVEQDLSAIGRRAEYRHLAPYLLASVALRGDDWAAGEACLRRAVRQNPDDLKAQGMLAAVLRHRGRRDQAMQRIRAVLDVDPLNGRAIVEQMFLGGPNELDVLADDPQYYLEIACDYAAMNLRDDAVSVLKLFANRSSARKHPFVYYYLGYDAHQRDAKDEAARWYKLGDQLSADYVFPFRAESFPVLETGLEYQPGSWKLHYYLGTLLVSKSRWLEGLEQFLTAEKASPKFAPLYANLGAIYAKKVANFDKARRAFETALRFRPNDYHYYLALDRLHAKAGQQQLRQQLFAKAPPEVENDFRIVFARAVFEYDQEHFERVLDILRKTTFLPWEGQVGVRQLYERVLHRLADQQLTRGNVDKATDYLKMAMEYPENLGVGKPHNPDYSSVYYKLGLCYRARGNVDEARRYFSKTLRRSAEDSPWHGRAADALKQLDQQEPK